jgi:hypothetical protein
VGEQASRSEDMAKHQNLYLSRACKREQSKQIHRFKANMIEEQAEATEELIAALTEKHTQQMEILIKSTTTQ